MSIIVHPLTAVNGSPVYSADDYRHVVNSLQVVSDGTPFGGVSGVRYTGTEPLVSVDGTTVTVQPHIGFYGGWPTAGVYTYAVESSERVDLESANSSYKVYVRIDDPSQSHGDTPGGQLAVVNANTADSNINGVVLATVSDGEANETAVRVDMSGKLYAPSLSVLNSVNALDGTLASVWTTNSEYKREYGQWVQTNSRMLVTAKWDDPLLVEVALQPINNSISVSGININGATHMATLHFHWDIKGSSNHQAWESTVFATMSGWTATHEAWGPVYDNANDNIAALRCWVNDNIITLRARENYTLYSGCWYIGSVVFPCKRV